MDVFDRDSASSELGYVVFSGVVYTSDNKVHNVYETWEAGSVTQDATLTVDTTDKLLEVFNGMNYCWNYISISGNSYWIVARSIPGSNGQAEIFTMNPATQDIFGMYNS